MSGIINKVKEAVHGHKNSSHDEPEGTHGPHGSRAANAADPRIDSDRDGRADPHTHGSSGLTGSHGTTGTHGSSGLTGSHGTTGTHGSSGLTGSNYNTSTNAGPHDSNAANKLDPRVDSDRDASRTVGGNNYGSSGVTGTHGTTGTHGSSGLTGSHGTTGTHGSGLTGSNYNTSTTAGPHDSNVANKLDPRVDSDRDASRTVGGNNYGSSGVTGTHGSSGLTGSHGTTGTHGSSGLTGSHGTTGTHGSGLTGSNYNSSTNAGPHDSNALNKVDPRVDSDRDASRTVGGNNYGSSGLTGSHGTTGTHGTHGTTGTHGTHGNSGLTGAHTGPGPAPNTAGPHSSDAMNKLDPRVDSDRDGSKTLGQDKTYSSGHSDPTDAAQVPPSVLRKHIGEPELAHDDHHHGRERRNSKVSAQEGHRGL